MRLQRIYEYKNGILGLFVLVFSFNLNAIQLECEAAPTWGKKVLVQFAPFLDTDGYTNRTVYSCKNFMDPESCDEGMDNFKYCKKPVDQFLLRVINAKSSTFVVENRCDGGFKKYKKMGAPNSLDGVRKYQIDKNILLNERMIFQVKNQVYSATQIERSPALVLEYDDERNIYNLNIESFIEDHWIEEWTRDDIDISFFTESEYLFTSFSTTCIEKSS